MKQDTNRPAHDISGCRSQRRPPKVYHGLVFLYRRFPLTVTLTILKRTFTSIKSIFIRFNTMTSVMVHFVPR